MRAWQIRSYGGPEVLQLRDLPDPAPREGWVLIEVKAFGINRSELYSRQGHSGEAVTLPRVLGIECVGVVLDGGGTDLSPGQRVAAAMGSLGRTFDGGYAERTLVPRRNVYPVDTSLAWAEFGALPEMYLTAWGAVREAINLQAGQHLLIRGGTSSVGLACASIAKRLGATVFATTRSLRKVPVLERAGVDYPLVDKGRVRDDVLDQVPEGVNAVVELVGMEHTITDGLACTAPKGTVCLVGFLGNSWEYDFFPWMPSLVSLTIYSTETLETHYATPVLQEIVQQVERGNYATHLHQTFTFSEVPKAHQIMEQNRAAGKLVVVLE